MMTATKPQADQPQRVDDYPAVRVAIAKHGEMAQMATDLERELREITAKLRSAPAVNQTSLEAEALLNGGKPPQDSIAMLRQRYIEVQKQMAVAEEAARMAKDAIETARNGVRAQFAESVLLPEWQKLAADGVEIFDRLTKWVAQYVRTLEANRERATCADLPPGLVTLLPSAIRVMIDPASGNGRMSENFLADVAVVRAVANGDKTPAFRSI